ncbi:DUF3574 domain-containing protein [Thalassobaculum sp.]|uniref:DUF3574 domain-containing protein n=1 Tax=Thalassobaculum sp. TaxID=2022740 RepID=UPI0032F0433F
MRILLALVIILLPPVAVNAAECGGNAWVETTLYMGRGQPDGGVVTDTQVQAFVDDIIVPAFPDGFTVADARGHWLDRATGRGIGETTVMLIVAHPPGAGSDAALQRVADAYIARFNQSAVLRSSHPVCVTFYEKK